MSTIDKGNREIMARLGFDLLGHLEDMRGKGVRSIEMDKCTQASSAALRTWEDSNYPYRLPADIRAFLQSSDGFSLSWTAKHHEAGGDGGGDGGGGGREAIIGRIRVDRLSAMKRVPLDADDLRDMAFSRARASAGAGTGAGGATRTGPLSRSSPSSSSPVSPDGVRQARGRDNDCTAGSGGRAERQAPAHTAVSTNSAIDNSTGGGGGGGGGEGGGGSKGGGRAYGIAAFSLDSSCEVGRVALVYGGAPTGGGAARRVLGVGRESKGKGVAVAELASPEVWLQDMSCRWHFLADSFTGYFRMMLVHLGVLGWQQAFSPVGLSPSTEQCMRLYCPDRLLFDQLEWQKERAKARAAKEVASDSAYQAGSGSQAGQQTALRRHS